MTVIIIIIIILAAECGFQDLSSPVKDWIHTLDSESEEL